MEKLVNTYGIEVSNAFQKENGKFYYTSDCLRCCGDGILRGFMHIDNGVCFRCSGSRKEQKASRAYTPKEFARKQANKERAATRKINKANQERQERLANLDSLLTRVDIAGIMAYRARWNSTEKKPFHYDTAIEMIDRAGTTGLSQKAVSFLEKIVVDFEAQHLNREAANANKIHVGTPGVREEFSVTIKFRKELPCQYQGFKEMVKLETPEGNELVYFGKALIGVPVDHPLVIKATVKTWDDYQGTKYTIVTRPKVLSNPESSDIIDI